MVDSSYQYDVAIIGFGPVGTVAAGLLSRAGLRVVVIESRETIFPQPRAIALDHEIMRVLQAIGAADAIMPRLGIYQPTEFVGVDGLSIARYMSRPREVSNCWESNYVFLQPELEAEMRTALMRSDQPPDILLKTRFLSVKSSAEECFIQVETDSGNKGIRAKFVLGCDGANSDVRKSTGSQLASLSFDRPFVVVDALVNEQALAELPQVNVQYCDPQRPATYIIGPENLRRWEIMQFPTDPDDIALPGQIEKLLGRWIAEGQYELLRSASYTFHALVATEWRCDRVFLLGDAAHQTPPFLGQGMCQGIRDAFNLCWKLDWVLRGIADDRLLDTYETERGPHVRATTDAAITLGSVICELDVRSAAIRDQKSRETFGIPPKTVFRQSLIPNLLFGAISMASPGGGTLFPQPMVTSKTLGICRLDDVTGPKVRVVTTEAYVGSLQPGGREMLRSIGAAIIVAGDITQAATSSDIWVEDQDCVVAEWLVQNNCSAVLVRPDNYVFGGVRKGLEFEPLLREFLQYVR
jgi:3-(3-hydroxy-phenyl)propionate hydroxylase